MIKTGPLKTQTFQRTLLRWFDDHGRKDLPWQHDKTPYRVWISEIMLQQTQVSTVIPYYQRFMKRFPTLASLADADEDSVLHHWSGLGYYRRARYLHAAAKKIMADFAGEFPDTLPDLESLPGIGRSTGGAILAIAFKKKATILDGNVKRVLTRLHGIHKAVDDKTLWTLAEKYTPEQRVGDYTQAIMDLGATLCIRANPRCDACLFESQCIARAQGIEQTLPLKRLRKTLPTREATFLLLRINDSVLIEKRPGSGVWASLWSLPEIQGSASLKDIRDYCHERFKISVDTVNFLEPFRHTFSHFHLIIIPAIITVTRYPHKIMDDQQQRWYNLRESQPVGIPAPVKLLFDNIEKLP